MTDAERFFAHGFYAALAEQFTHFNTLLLDGLEVSNPTDQHLESSITHLSSVTASRLVSECN